MSCPDEIGYIWDLVRSSFREELSQTAFDLWFGNLIPQDFHHETNEVVILADSKLKKDYLQRNYKEKIEERFLSNGGLPITVSFTYSAAPPEMERATERFIENISGGAELKKQKQKEDQAANTLRSRYRFDNFIVGESNKFARAVCYGVATAPSKDYNPLFLYGPSGVGKTHLMYAVINEMMRQNPATKVIYAKGDEFINFMIECLSINDMPAFRARYRNCDVLLIDDIQFIAGKQGLQEEFFHTFQSLFDEGKQIILASDRPPKDINPLEERLRSRFEQGMLADINPPDLELRTSIIKQKAENCGIDIPGDVLTFLSENLRSNIRQIEGAIRKLAAKSMVESRPISMELAKSCVADMLGDSEPLEVTIDKIFAAVAKKYNVSVEDVKSKKRNAEIAIARHVTIYLVWKITEISLPHIGKIFGRDHTTVLSSINVIKERMPRDPLFENDISTLYKEVTGG